MNIRWLMAPTILLLLPACVSTNIEQIRQANTGIAADESVVIMGRKNRSSISETEEDFVTCVNTKLANNSKGFGVVPQKTFTDALFPWFEPRTAPLNSSELPKMLREPLIAERLKEIGVHYIVWIQGSTDRVDQAGAMSCVATVGAAGCFGFLTWENDATYEASIWDVKTGTSAGNISSEANGTSFVTGVVVPIPIIARVQSAACTSLSSQLSAFIRNEA
ncbi:MAG: hypothetical protein KUG75_11085 [Pseudomonadales bacterium]|nr:hypothetical protein [Pseudomonadales bacterium]